MRRVKPRAIVPTLKSGPNKALRFKRSGSQGPLFTVGSKRNRGVPLLFCSHSEEWARQGTALKRSGSQGPLFTVGSKRNRRVPLLFCSHSEEWARQGTALKRSDSLGPLFRVGTRQKGDLDSLFRLSEQPKL